MMYKCDNQYKCQCNAICAKMDTNVNVVVRVVLFIFNVEEVETKMLSPWHAQIGMRSKCFHTPKLSQITKTTTNVQNCVRETQ